MVRFGYFRCAALWLWLCALHHASVAAEFRSRGAHVHGNATLDIAMQDATLDIEFESPAINVIGFEHAPGTDQEKTALMQANRAFDAGNQLFAWPAAAACKQVSVKRTPITFERDGDDDKPNAPQANYEVAYRFTCAHPQKLDSIDVKLFGVTRGMQKITANLVTATIQRQVELTPGHTQVSLQAD
jgi:hypothetical protein